MRSRVEALLAQGPNGEKIATSIKLAKDTWEATQALCRDRGIGPSELMEAMLDDLLAGIQAPRSKPGRKPKMHA